MGLLIHCWGDLDVPHPPPCKTEFYCIEAANTVRAQGVPIRTRGQGENNLHIFKFKDPVCLTHISPGPRIGSPTVFVEGTNVCRKTDALANACTAADTPTVNSTVFAG